AVALVAIPAGIAALGFTGAGIAAGSIAAKMMSAAAIANGGGVAAGSTVAVLQSI
ncbi:PREDICTED: interferon alpha-inducible protein 27-like protein 2A, partial [Acanthisitta chloris]|uniref:interferon alpha-inducible protein 27-like protein 2A n=1 Tax=Acanthisitta chloris TaxID=57068 RepID=UPI0004F0FBB9